LNGHKAGPLVITISSGFGPCLEFFALAGDGTNMVLFTPGFLEIHR